MPYQTVNGIKMYYETTGEGPPVVFLHGLGSSTRDWEFQLGFFSKDHQMITVDTRGHGRSEKPKGPYSVPLFASDIAALIRALAVGPVDVVGISMGGMIAFQLALDAPELVRRVVIVNSFPELIARTLKDRLMFLQRFIIVRFIGLRKMGQVLAERLLPKPEHAELRQIFEDRWAENDLQAYQASMNALNGWSVKDRLGEIKCPVLVMTGDHDYTTVESKAEYAKLIPNAELVVMEDSRHATPVEHPDAFNNVVKEFLEK